MLNCAWSSQGRWGSRCLRAALAVHHTTGFDTSAGDAAWPRHRGHSDPISSCISGPTAISGRECKAQTTCAEPPGSAATSQETSSHVLHESPLTSIAPGSPRDKTHSLPSRWNVNMIFTVNYIHCVIYIFNLNITYPFKYR